MTAVFKLGTFVAGESAPFAGFVLDDAGPVYTLATVLAVTGHPAQTRSVREVLEHWPSALPGISAAAQSVADRPERFGAAATPLSSLRVLPPVWPPGQLFQAGANYRSHVWQIECGMRRAEGQSEEEAASAENRVEFSEAIRSRIANDPPIIFSGVNHSISGAYDDIVLPARHGQNPDWELELGVVFGRTARYVAPQDALEHVAGYVIANDVSHRPPRGGKRPQLSLGADWLAMKNSPTFTPTGPYLVPAQFVSDPMTLRIELRLNGTIQQDESTADMIYDLSMQISRLSHLTVIEPGDMLLTGSPSGNGLHTGRFLEDGDVLEGTITGLGVQRTRVAAEPISLGG